MTKTAQDRWNVIFINDDHTTMDFVVCVLIRYFDLDLLDAISVMLEANRKGQAIVAGFEFDEAVRRLFDTVLSARKRGFPLELRMEPAAAPQSN